MNLKELSTTAKRVQTSGVGYRYEGISTGAYPIQESLKFEIKELGNKDVFFTLEKLYNIKTRDVKKVINWVYDTFKEQTVYGFWVSSKVGIERNYINGYEYEDGPVTLLKYTLPKKRLILSDLDDEGVWFAIAVHPDNLPYDEVKSYKCINKYNM